MERSRLKFIKKKKQMHNEQYNGISNSSRSAADKDENFALELFPSVEQNIENFKKMYGYANDLSARVFLIGKYSHKAALLFINGLADNNLINELVLGHLEQDTKPTKETLCIPPDELLETLYKETVLVSNVTIADTIDDVSLAILSGDTALFLEGTDKVLIIGSKGGPFRSIEEPMTEGLIRGPRDGFIENLQTNAVLIRRNICDPNLRFDAFKIGRRSKKNVLISYIAGIVHPELVNEVKRRVQSIDIDAVPESGYIEQWIQDSFLSPFPQIMHTERPDKVSAALAQGKIAILLDGTPFVLVVPYIFGNAFQSPEDYYNRWMFGTSFRMLRYAAAFIAVFLPSIYIALVSYHPGMIPSKLAFSIAATREGVPVPAFIEAIAMAVTMELLQEAGVRLPKTIGQTIGIVGGLVIGEAAVTAGIVSPIMVIVVAITAIASFALPSYSIAISFRLLRFGIMIAASLFGLYGIILSYIIINVHLVNLKSFGVPYTSVFAPSFLDDWKDLIIRAPLPMLKKRPAYLQPKDEKNINKGGAKK